MSELTPREIVNELDRYIIGQNAAKRAVAIALRNRWRRMQLDPGLREGLAFLTFHFPDQVATNELTIDAVDPKSGTSEFKATAVRIEPVHA